MKFTVMTRHRFGYTDPDKMVEQFSVTNGEIAEKIVEQLRKETFIDRYGRRRRRYGARGAKVVSQD